jgi:hypothetical protein
MTDQDTTVRTWWLDEAEIAATIAKISKINARAAKNGLAGGYTWTLGAERREPVYDDAGARLVIDGIPHFIEKGQPVPCPLIGFERERELIVSGDAPKLGGWSFIASLTWDGGVLVTRCTPGFEGRIDEAQIREGACDHCQVDRQRLDCYLLQHADGRRVQVGSSCIKDFLGHNFRPSMLFFADELDEIRESIPATRTYLDAAVETVLTWAASICAQTGWISRDKAEIENRTPSGWVLRDCLFGSGKAGREARDTFAPSDEHETTAATVLAWARELEPGDSEYLANVRRVASSEYVTERTIAILGSSVASYWREHNARVEREARPVSQFVGCVKDRLVLDVIIRSDTAIDGDWGVSHLYTMTDASGNVFGWFSSKNQCWQIGQDVRIKGTIKEHSEYRGTRRTMLTRCAEVAR